MCTVPITHTKTLKQEIERTNAYDSYASARKLISILLFITVPMYKIINAGWLEAARVYRFVLTTDFVGWRMIVVAITLFPRYYVKRIKSK